MQIKNPAKVLSFGRHIERMRMARELTQEQLAERSALAIDTIREIEAGTISASLDALRRISRGFGVSLAELFEGFERQESGT